MVIEKIFEENSGSDSGLFLRRIRSRSLYRDFNYNVSFLSFLTAFKATRQMMFHRLVAFNSVFQLGGFKQYGFLLFLCVNSEHPVINLVVSKVVLRDAIAWQFLRLTDTELIKLPFIPRRATFKIHQRFEQFVHLSFWYARMMQRVMMGPYKKQTSTVLYFQYQNFKLHVHCSIDPATFARPFSIQLYFFNFSIEKYLHKQYPISMHDSRFRFYVKHPVKTLRALFAC